MLIAQGLDGKSFAKRLIDIYNKIKTQNVAS